MHSTIVHLVHFWTSSKFILGSSLSSHALDVPVHDGIHQSSIKSVFLLAIFKNFGHSEKIAHFRAFFKKRISSIFNIQTAHRNISLRSGIVTTTQSHAFFEKDLQMRFVCCVLSTFWWPSTTPSQLHKAFIASFILAMKDAKPVQPWPESVWQIALDLAKKYELRVKTFNSSSEVEEASLQYLQNISGKSTGLEKLWNFTPRFFKARYPYPLDFIAFLDESRDPTVLTKKIRNSGFIRKIESPSRD